MKVILARTPDELYRFAARFTSRQVRARPSLVLGLATGRTMIAYYRELVALHRAGEVSFAGCTSFNLDEYVGIPEDHPSSYHAFMRRHLGSHVDLPPARMHLLDGNARDVLHEAAGYEAAIRQAGGIDLQLLGIGQNGHVAFNEPGSSLASRTRVKRLTPSTMKANAEDFGSPDAVPKYVMTMGVGTILDARFVLLLASGASKARAVAAMIEGPVTAQRPASVLQLHRHAFVVADPDAAAALTHAPDTVEDVLADPYEEFFFEGA
jgi:glucosamine-6-phosphate deaminase